MAYQVMVRQPNYPHSVTQVASFQLLPDAARDLVERTKFPKTYDIDDWFVLDARSLVCYQLDDDNDLVACLPTSLQMQLRGRLA